MYTFVFVYLSVCPDGVVAVPDVVGDHYKFGLLSFISLFMFLFCVFLCLFLCLYICLFVQMLLLLFWVWLEIIPSLGSLAL